jgi:hypothetical protein
MRDSLDCKIAQIASRFTCETVENAAQAASAALHNPRTRSGWSASHKRDRAEFEKMCLTARAACSA